MLKRYFSWKPAVHTIQSSLSKVSPRMTNREPWLVKTKYFTYSFNIKFSGILVSYVLHDNNDICKYVAEKKY